VERRTSSASAFRPVADCSSWLTLSGKGASASSAHETPLRESEGTMSRRIKTDERDDVLPEYDFSQGVRGRHHHAYRAGTNVVHLDADVAAAFKDSAAVNEALRLLMKVARERVPARRSRRSALLRSSAPKRRV
jgi:hypothetical protein